MKNQENAHIQRSLDQEAQRIDVRNPENLNPETIAEAVEGLKKFMAQHDYSGSSFARKIGVSSSAINKFLAGTYKGNFKDLINRINSFINTTSRQVRQSRPEPFVNTTVAQKIKTLIVNTQSFSLGEGKIGLIIGDSGHGKSHCLRAYAKADLNAIYCELDDCMSSTKMFAAIARALSRRKNAVDVCGGLSDIAARLAAILRDLHVVILLDEASGLNVKQLNQLRQIIVVKGRTPLILAGNVGLLSTISRGTTRQGHESLDQFTSRLMQILDLDGLALDDSDDDLYPLSDIVKLYQFGGVRLTNSGAGALRKIAKSPNTGRHRTCTHIIIALHTSPEVQEKGYIDGALIIRAIQSLNLPFKLRLPLAVQGSESSKQSVQAASVAG